MKSPAVRKPGWFWTFLVLGLIVLVGAGMDAVHQDWWSTGFGLVSALVFLSLPFRLAR